MPTAGTRPSLGVLALFWLTGACSSPPPRTVDEDESLVYQYIDVSQLNVTIGSLHRDDSDWEPFEDQFTIGIDWAEEFRSPFVFAEGGLHWAIDEEDTRIDGNRREIDVQTLELSVGLRAELPMGALLRPYVGAGAGVLFGDLEDPDQNHFLEVDDTVLGAYAKLGLQFLLTPDTHFGVEVRGFFGPDIELEDLEGDSSSVQLTLVLGARF